MRVKHSWRIALASAVGLFIVAVLAIACVIPLRRGYTVPYRSSGSIALLEEATLGGSKQWILIRGSNIKNPVLLFLHGGPGMPTMYLAHDFQRELERSFIVVQWDRRGAGKSFTAGMSPEQMSVSQEINDTVELIDQLRARFHQQKVYMVCFSYGSYLGILVAQRVPERLHAYVGIGQLACSETKNRAIQDTWIREQATRAHDPEAIEELDGKRPRDREKWLFKYGGEIHSARNWWPLLWSGLRSPGTHFKTSQTSNGAWPSPYTTCDTMSSTARFLRMYRTSEFQWYFFTGRFDYTDPTQCTIRLFEEINAPVKKLVWFDRSAHFVFLEEPSRFAAEMRRVMQETKAFEESRDR